MPQMKTYELFSGEELVIAEKIQQRRLQMLVHSCIYYEMDYNIISDKQWDAWSKELVVLQRDNPEISKQVDWYDAFADWDGSSGAFLPLKDPWVIEKAMKLTGRGIKKFNVSQNGATKKKSLFDMPIKKATNLTTKLPSKATKKKSLF